MYRKLNLRNVEKVFLLLKPRRKMTHITNQLKNILIHYKARLNETFGLYFHLEKKI